MTKQILGHDRCVKVKKNTNQKQGGSTEFYCEYRDHSLLHNSCKANEANNHCAISNEY